MLSGTFVQDSGVVVLGFWDSVWQVVFGSGVKCVLKTCPEIPPSLKVGSIPKVFFECLFGGSSLLSMCGWVWLDG